MQVWNLSPLGVHILSSRSRMRHLPGYGSPMTRPIRISLQTACRTPWIFHGFPAVVQPILRSPDCIRFLLSTSVISLRKTGHISFPFWVRRDSGRAGKFRCPDAHLPAPDPSKRNQPAMTSRNVFFKDSSE